MRSKTYIIPIQPIPWKRVGLHKNVFYDKQKAEKLAVGLYLAQQHNDEKLHGPLSMDVTFFMPVNRTVSRRTKGIWCYKDPDLDNLIKFIADSITDTQVIWNDDNQVAQCTAKKIYDKEPRTILILSELE